MYSKEELHRKLSYDRSEERQKVVADLWESRGEELWPRLALMMNLPVIKTDRPGKLLFYHVKYKKKGEAHSKWLKEVKQHKKWEIMSVQMWSFYPIRICRKTDLSTPKDLKYAFLVESVSKEAQAVEKADSTKSAEAESIYTGLIETAYDGTILEWGRFNGTLLTCFPKFPKSMLAKINRCLANNFLPELWVEAAYAKWHRTDEGRARYMLTYKYEKVPYIEPLLSLLNSEYGGAAAILLAFACFSVAKPFFPQYRSLDKTSSYLKAKKLIPKQLSICIRSDPPDNAIWLADCCCGCFRPDEPYTGSVSRKYRKAPVIDGVDIQTTCSNAYLSIDTWEAAVLQPACVLWVNRRPTQELEEKGWVIDIELPPHLGNIEVERFALDMIADWAEKISKETVRGYHTTLKADWETSAPKIDEMLTEMKQVLLKHSVAFNEEKMEEAHAELRVFSGRNIFYYFKRLESWIRSDLQYIIERYGRGDDDPLLSAEDEIENLLAQCRRLIRKNHKQNITKHFSFGALYKKEILALKADPKYSGIDPDTLEKMAYLRISFSSFAHSCLPEESCKEVLSIFRKSLDELFVKTDISPREILEKYIMDQLKAGHYARVRGEGSGRPDVQVWYDWTSKKCDEESSFLLPQKTYFSKLPSATVSVTQQQWERLLVDEGLILCVDREMPNGKKQKRRSFEIRLKEKSDERQAVIKIKYSSLSREFREEAIVKAALAKMQADPSPQRFRTTALSKGK